MRDFQLRVTPSCAPPLVGPSAPPFVASQIFGSSSMLFVVCPSLCAALFFVSFLLGGRGIGGNSYD